MRKTNHHSITDTDRILIALTSLALNAPSAYTIAWSKGEHSAEMPILYAGLGTSALTVLGAMTNDKLMWSGLAATMAVFGYTVFFYKPSVAAVKAPARYASDSVVRVNKMYTVTR